MAETLLAAAALAIALVALALALDARRTARRRERRAVVAAEAAPAPREVAPTSSAEEAARRAVDLGEALRRRVDLLEAAPAPTAAPAPAPLPAALPPMVPVARVRDHVRSLGYDDVEVVPVDGAGRAFGVEARRDGATAKGRATVDDEGRVSARLSPSFRAFP